MASQDDNVSSQLNEAERLEPSSDNAQLSSPWQQQPKSTGEIPSTKSDSKPEEAAIKTNPRLEALTSKKAKLEETLATLQAQRSALVSQANLPSGLAMPDSWSDEERTKSALTNANGVIKEHIGLLHKYNEIKDIAQGLMGLIADKRGVRVATVMEEYGMSEKD